MTRRNFIHGCFAAGAVGISHQGKAGEPPTGPALVSISFNLEMMRGYPTPQHANWDYEKGNLDAATKKYALEAARRVKAAGGRINAFIIGSTLEQEDIEWLKELAREGHLLGNHSYDHVALKAATGDAIQHRFRRSPWLVAGRKPAEVIEENIRLAHVAVKQRLGVECAGFCSPSDYREGLVDRPDLQQLMLSLGYRWVCCKSTGVPRELGAQGSEQALQAIVAAQKETQPFVYPSGLIEIPRSVPADASLFRAARWSLSSYLEAVRRTLDWTVENRGLYHYVCHPALLSIEDPDMKIMDILCDTVRRHAGQATLADLNQVAAQFAGKAKVP
jgi:peptidoglycan/xylan/chitin deacetylase (PgdA/CDA1 family)